MELFHDFTVSDWKILSGNLLMFATCAFYLVWWGIAFKPNGNGPSGVTGLLLAGTMIAGIASIILLSLGIASFAPLAGQGKGITISFILIGAVAAYIVLLGITKTFFQRPVTSELLIMVLWAAVEIAAIEVLRQSGRFGLSQSLILTLLVTLATVAGLVCYVLYYRLDGKSGYIDGFIPLAVDSVVVAVFLALHALS